MARTIESPLHIFNRIHYGVSCPSSGWSQNTSPISILLTWVGVATKGSVLMTAVLHAALNGAAPLMAGIDADASWAIRNVLAGVIALAIVVSGVLRDLGRCDRSALLSEPRRSLG